MAKVMRRFVQNLRRFGKRTGLIKLSSPSTPVCLSVNANTVTISWTADVFEAKHTTYQILVRRALNEEWIESIIHLEENNLQTTIKDLMYDTKYQFQVCKMFEDGTCSPFSKPSESITTEKIPTEAPRFVSSNSNEITVSWCMIQPGVEPVYFEIRQKQGLYDEWVESIFDETHDKTRATIHNLNHDTRYIFQIRAVYENGEMSSYSESSDVMYTKPPSPSAPVLALVNANSITIKWTTIQQDIEPLIYLVRHRLIPNTEWVESTFDETRDKMRATIHNLKFDSQYEFQVSSIYADGEMSPFSDSSLTMKTEPSPTSAPVCTSIHVNKVTLSWSLIEQQAKPIDFEIRHKEESSREWVQSKFEGKAKEMQVTVYNLNYYVKYHFQVRALYRDGLKSSYSEPSESILTERQPPFALACVSVNGNTIQISWSRVQQDDEPSYYRVRQKLGSYTEWVESTFDETGNEMQATIHNLKFDSQYQFQVCSVYADGETSPFSESSLSMKTEPSPTSAPVCTSIHVNKVTLSWSLIEQQAKPIDFEIRHKEESSREWVQSKFEGKAKEMQVTVYNLNYYVKYHFQVRALYRDGLKSSYSEPSESILTERPPPFALACVSVNGNTIQISWSRVQQDDEPSYYRVRQKLSSYTEWVESTFDETGNEMQATIHNLKFDSQYQFQVCSVYADGETSPFSESSLSMKTEPSPTSAPVCTSIHVNKVTLSWSLIEQQAKPIDFEIRHKEESSREWVQSKFEGKAKEMQVTVYNLNYYVKYHFQVRALYRDGLKSSYSEPSESILTERPPPFALACVSVNGNTIQISWSRIQQDDEPSYYRVRQKLSSYTEWVESTFDETGNEMQATIHNLKFDSQYQFQVCSVYADGETSPFSESSLSMQTELSPPSGPVCTSFQQNTITLSWSMIQEGKEPTKFEIRQREESDSKWVKSKFFRQNRMQATVQNLKYNTQYRFQVRSVYAYGKVSPYSEPSVSITSGPSPAADIIPLCTPVTGKSQHPRQYNLPVFEDERLRNTEKRTRKSVVATGQVSMEVEEKIILMVGKRGAGKSTLIDGLANYLNGVVWEDDFRYRIVNTNSKEKQATEWVTSYAIRPSSPISSQSFVLTIIDTPGFDDSSGSKQDEELVSRIQSFFPELRQQGKGTIDAVCFVTQSQITNQQTQVFDFMLSIFGKDIKDNIVVMATFADENEPPVLKALQYADVPYTKMFKFNSDCLFENSIKNTDPVRKLHWSMNMDSFHNFISHLLQMPKRSLQLTSRVMDTRAIITTIISGLHPLIIGGLEDINIINTEKGLMKEFENEILQNKRFTYKIPVHKQRKSDLDEGTHVTNCLVCNFTCHYPCAIPDDQEKAGCASMSDNYCTVCIKKCHWQEHKNNGYKIEWYKEEQTFTNEDMRRKYGIAIRGKHTKEDFIRELEKAYQEKRNHVRAMLKQVFEYKKFLTENALRASTLTVVSSIDLMIQTENEEQTPGYAERVELLRQFRREAE